MHAPARARHAANWRRKTH